MKYFAASGIADKDGDLISMSSTFDDSRLTKEQKARFLKLKAIQKPNEHEDAVFDEETEEHTRESLMKKSIEILTDIAKGLSLTVPEKPTKAGLTALILGEEEEK